MANISTNPWSFTNSDQATSVSISSIVSSGASALVTTGSAHGLSLNQQISIQGVTGANHVPNNGYEVLSIPSTTTFLIQLPTPTFASSGASGNVLTVAYPYKVRIEQMSWVAAPASSTITITDTNGNLVWTYTTSATADQVYTYGKLYWVDGLVLNSIPSGSTVLATIN